MQIVIPYKQRGPFKDMHSSRARFRLMIAHRRAGKTVACINELIKKAISSSYPDSRFAYVAPFYRQAKNVAWDYLKRFSFPIPGIKINESELRVDYPNGSRISLFGSDKADALRGLGFNGIVVDEFDDWRPGAWEYVILPALADRKGWAIVIGTVKGRASLYKKYTDNSRNWDKWIVKASDSGILDQEELDLMSSEMSEDSYRQEMECDWDAAVRGAVYGKEIYAMRMTDRIKPDIYDPNLKVHVAMDIGWNDDTVLVFFQCAKELRVIDAYSANHEDVEHYDRVMRSKPYEYGNWLWLPHDARAKSMQTKRSVEEQFMSRGWKTRIVPSLSLIDGINAARLSLKDAYISSDLEGFIDALSLYQFEYDDKLKTFKDHPRHDWTSHYADAFRYACLVWREEHKPKEVKLEISTAPPTIDQLIRRQKQKYASDD